MSQVNSMERPLGRGKRIALGIVGVLIVFLSVGPPEFGALLLFTSWTSDVDGGAHKLHELMHGVSSALMLASGLILILKPAWTLGAVQKFIAVGAGFLLAGILSAYVWPPVIIYPVLAALTTGVMLWAFRGRIPWLGSGSAFRALSRTQLAVTALIAVPLIRLGLDHVSLQRSADTLHGDLGHWAGGTAVAISIILLLGFAALRLPGWRVPAWMGGATLFVLGLGSALMPEQASSIGVAWGLVAMASAAGFVALAEYEGRAGAVSVTASPVRAAGS